jgi:hypothetical protein
VQCAVRLHHPPGELPVSNGSTCWERTPNGDGAGGMVRMGHEFECSERSPGRLRWDVSAECPGFELKRSASFRWNPGDTCKSVKPGTLSLRRVEKDDGEE